MAQKIGTIPKEEVILFTRQLALVIDSDMSLHEGLTLIKEKSDHLSLKQVIQHLLEQLESGQTFGEALRLEENVFSPFLIHMIDVGEKSGNLTGSLNQIATAYEQELEARNKIKSAVTYPIILSVLMLGVILLLILKVLPMFNNILASLGGEMPPLTKSILGVSLFIGKYLWVFIVLILILGVVTHFYRQTKKGRFFFDRLRFTFPIIKNITASLSAVRFARNLASLLRSGISTTLALGMIQPLMNNLYVEERIKQAIELLKEGSSTDQVIESLDLFPWVLVKLFSVAEATGHMDQMLDKAADVMEEDANQRLANLTTVIEPILIIFLSLIIGVILISVILPIISIMNAIG